MPQMGNFALDSFMYYPRLVGPSNVQYSTDNTYVKALERYRAVASHDGAQLARVVAQVSPHGALRVSGAPMNVPPPEVSLVALNVSRRMSITA